MACSYGRDWYAEMAGGARRSAAVVVPLVVELVRPRSAVDVGCGVGGWLAELAACGVEDLVGVDRADVHRDLLEIPGDRFQERDLSEPFELGRHFDLALSLEVAEHLPEGSADGFIESLTTLAPVVLFSAAIPAQPGEHHVNLRWQSWWAERFRARGYLPVDCLRRRVWDDERVEWWYAQNALLYVESGHLADHEELAREHAAMGESQLSIVHPGMHELLVAWAMAERSKRG